MRESVKGKWAGDEDLGDGKLEDLKKGYDQRREFARSLGLGHREGHLQEDLHLLLFAIERDTMFLCNGEKQARDLYVIHLRQS